MKTTRPLTINRQFRQVGFILAASLLGGAITQGGDPDGALPRRSVFTFPAVLNQSAALSEQLSGLLRAGRYADAEKTGTKLIEIMPELPEGYYNLACAQALQGKTEMAFENLNHAIKRGFNGAREAEKDPDLKSLRQHAAWPATLRAMRAASLPPPERRQVAATMVTNRIAMVSESNTAWNGQFGLLQSFFNFPEWEGSNQPPVSGQGNTGDSIRRWFKEGTAAGLYGDLYDNRDGRHSPLNLKEYPQLTGVEYAPEAQTNSLNHGLQLQLLFNRITIGNASLANTSGSAWRSMPRLAYVNAGGMARLYLQYVGNHIYMYPEHRDYDPGRNGKDGGHGDVYCGNCPYVIISQGSSGSDQTFLNAVACTLAAFHPDVKPFLASRGALMPTVQMLLRSSLKSVKTNEDYLTGKAHRVVMDGSQVDVTKMVERAHALTMDNLPPQIVLKVMDEDQAVAGRDYFSPLTSEILYETPAAIGRVVRSMQYERRIVVSAGESRDFTNKPLSYHWRVLQGDQTRIRLKPLNKSGSLMELTVPYHERFPVEPGSAMEANRVDIGAFVHNGDHYSAPAFVSFYYLDNEKRVYGSRQELLSTQYSGALTPGNYVDPMVDLPKDWLDEYQYDKSGALTGWIRTLNGDKQEFTADGKLIVSRDATGKPAQTNTVSYGARRLPSGKLITEQNVAP